MAWMAGGSESVHRSAVERDFVCVMRDVECVCYG